MQLFLQYILPLAIHAIRLYLKNNDTSHDSEILDLTKRNCQYLAQKDNNTMTYGHVSNIGSVQYFGEDK